VSTPASGPSTANGARILFVDDEQQLVTVTKRLLERQGFKVAAFVDAAQALDALRADPAGFDLIVTDANMPAISGVELAAQAHALRAELPVLLTSGYVSDELRVKAAAAGITGIVHKPSTLQALLQAIREALAGAPPHAAE